MKIQLPSGVVLESSDASTCEQWLKSGGKEVAEVVTSADKPPRKQYSKKQKEDKE